MGFMDWLKGTFGKQACAFCGNEVGMMKRSKIKNKEFICQDCGHGCSRYIQKYRYTKDELLGHMEYMKRQDRIYHEILEGKHTKIVPHSAYEESIEFYDNHGMFYVRNRTAERQGFLCEPFRYDQVASYKPYLVENEPSEPGKPKEFKEWGIEIVLVGADTDMSAVGKGRRAHPYATETIRFCVNRKDRRIGEMEVNQIIAHFDTIFGVRDDTKGLFSFGPSKQQKREGEAARAMGGAFAAAIRTAKEGGEVSPETKAQFEEAMAKVDDAATSGLAEYSRRADGVEEFINQT